jgi:putative transposase
MTRGLRRIYGQRHLHFITCSCFQRMPLLNEEHCRTEFLQILADVRERYRFALAGYVVMPEHFHLLIAEPETGNPSVVLQVLKQRTARTFLDRAGRSTLTADVSGTDGNNARCKERHFWQKRFYDFNVWTEKKKVEKLIYMHMNPVTRGLVERPDQWPWSSYRYWHHQDGALLNCDWVE